jgi:hypothetical protein
MSILRLVVSFILSLLKPQRQLVLENLALRQQVTMLRQSVKRLRATAADKQFCSKRDVNKRKHHPTRHTRKPVAKPMAPNPSTTTPASSSSGISGVSTPLYPILFPASRNISARENLGIYL